MKRLFYIIIALLILISMVSCNSGLKENEKAQLNNEVTYLSIGDSITAGYALPEYIEDGKKVSGSFASKICTTINADTWMDLGVTGATSQETLEYIEEYNKKGYFTNSSIVTLSIGSNDIMGPGIQMIYDVCEVNSNDELFEKIERLKNKKDYVALASLALQIYNYIKSDEADSIFLSGVESANTNIIKIVDKIYEYSPNAKIYIVNFYNPLAEIGIEEYVDVGSIVQKYLGLMNEYIYSHEYNNRRYYIADVSSMRSDKTNVEINIDEGIISIDPHPNLLGHEYIYSKLIELITKYNDKQVSVEIDGEVSYYNTIEEGWNKVNSVLDKNVKMTFFHDWYSGSDYSFGSTIGYTKTGSISPVSRIDGDVKLELDLNGHTIDRCLYTSINGGEVFNLSFVGIFIIGDGTVTGGFNKDNGGGFVIEDKGFDIVLEGLCIAGNSTDKNGGGIYYKKRRKKLDISKAKIENNTCGIYGAVLFTENID